MNTYPTTAVKVWVESYGPLTDYEAQREACRLWDSLSFSARKAVEAAGVDGYIATHSGAEGLIKLRDMLAYALVAA